MTNLTILFDLDGTLINSTQAIIETFYYTFEKFDINFQGSPKDIEKLIGHTLEDMYKSFGVEETLIEKIVLAYKQKYSKISPLKTTLIDGALDSLKKANEIAKVGIVTTKTTKYTIPLLKSLKIEKYYQTIVGRMEVTNPKPHPEPILKALKNLNVSKCNTECFMIGDTQLDLISANKAGILSIGVLSGYGTYEELSTYSPFIVKNSLEAVELIDKNFNKAIIKH